MTEQGIETNKLFVGNLHWHIRWQELKEFFSQWGEVEYASVSLDRETKKSRGFGFVTFKNAEDATRAKAEANEQELHGRPIYIDFARARPEGEGEEGGMGGQSNEEEVDAQDDEE
jgi:cold-inducible RNA-binding protein